MAKEQINQGWWCPPQLSQLFCALAQVGPCTWWVNNVFTSSHPPPCCELLRGRQ